MAANSKSPATALPCVPIESAAPATEVALAPDRKVIQQTGVQRHQLL
jgi:hypothetical protein